ncbi:MAG: hypothetical protein QM619_01750 [Micropruina sp.]|uniref:hypothetical protein n=1 Tax=Micropruina sp. TaxID=2737536 RepID=UPI0039E214FB
MAPTPHAWYAEESLPQLTGPSMPSYVQCAGGADDAEVFADDAGVLAGEAGVLAVGGAETHPVRAIKEAAATGIKKR